MAIRPPLLKRGDTIGLVTLGTPLDADTINTRVQFLRNMGFNIVFGKHVYSYGGIRSTTSR